MRCSSVVRPPGVRRGDGGALVVGGAGHRRSVLALLGAHQWYDLRVSGGGMEAPLSSAEPAIGGASLRFWVLISGTTSGCPAGGWRRPCRRRSRPSAERPCASGCSSVVRPPGVRRGDGGALVVGGAGHRRSVLALLGAHQWYDL